MPLCKQVELLNCWLGYWGITPFSNKNRGGRPKHIWWMNQILLPSHVSAQLVLTMSKRACGAFALGSVRLAPVPHIYVSNIPGLDKTQSTTELKTKRPTTKSQPGKRANRTGPGRYRQMPCLSPEDVDRPCGNGSCKSHIRSGSELSACAERWKYSNTEPSALSFLYSVQEYVRITRLHPPSQTLECCVDMGHWFRVATSCQIK